MSVTQAEDLLKTLKDRIATRQAVVGVVAVSYTHLTLPTNREV